MKLSFVDWCRCWTLIDRNFCFTTFNLYPRLLPTVMACSHCLQIYLWIKKRNIYLWNGIFCKFHMRKLTNLAIIKNLQISILTVKITSALIFTWVNFVKLPGVVCYWFCAACIPGNGYIKSSVIFSITSVDYASPGKLFRTLGFIGSACAFSA